MKLKTTSNGNRCTADDDDDDDNDDVAQHVCSAHGNWLVYEHMNRLFTPFCNVNYAFILATLKPFVLCHLFIAFYALACVYLYRACKRLNNRLDVRIYSMHLHGRISNQYNFQVPSKIIIHIFHYIIQCDVHSVLLHTSNNLSVKFSIEVCLYSCYYALQHSQ